MKKAIVNTREEPAEIERFSPMYIFPHDARVTINELIEAVNYLLEKDRSK